MKFPLRIRKSAGIRVTPAVHGLIRKGDSARGQARWDEAARAFRDALTADPRLHHIRLQLGHMLKEAGALDDADAVYGEAARLRPDDVEPVRHRAHLAKLRLRPRAAIRLFMEALARGGAGDIEADLRHMLGIDDAIPPDVLRRVLLKMHPDEDAPPPAEAGPRDAAAADGAGGDERPLLFDITDLVGHFRYQRAPTGIQRVQIEVLERAVRRHGPVRVMMGSFVRGRGGMVSVPAGQILALVALARQGGDILDPAWQEARIRLFLHLALAPRITIPYRAILVNLGTSLWVTDYFLFIRNAKARRRISYIPFVHDLIPVMAPEYCVRSIRETFCAWLAGLFQHADGFLTNSRSTARDLAWAARYLGHDLAPDRVEVIPLDGDFRPDADLPPASSLGRWGLSEGSYALMVSTIEPRKNHVLAFDAWAQLLRRHGAAMVPRLVCVGRDGWLNEFVFARLAADPALIAGVTIIHRVSDAEMALLYRASRFTLYPSHYEGWGLPVTESLCHGRIAIVADNSSLPEASGGFGLMFESDSVPALVAAVERVAFDARWRRDQEARIATRFAPRSWEEITDQMIDKGVDLSGPASLPPNMPSMAPGVYYPVSLHRAPMLWPGLVGGEIFRIGEGWLWPEADGCRTAPPGGDLHVRLADDGSDRAGAAPKLYLRLSGLALRDCPVIVTISGRTSEAVVAAGRTSWVVCDIPAGAGQSFTVGVRGLHAETIVQPVDGQLRPRLASVGVVGMMAGAYADEEDGRRATESIDSWQAREG